MKRVVFFLILFPMVMFGQSINADFISSSGKRFLGTIETIEKKQGDLLSLEKISHLLEINYTQTATQVGIKIGGIEGVFLINSNFAKVINEKTKESFVYQFYEIPYLIDNKLLIHPREIKRMFYAVFKLETSYSESLRLLKISLAGLESMVLLDNIETPEEKTENLVEITDALFSPKENGIAIDFAYSGKLAKYEYISPKENQNTGYLTFTQAKINIEKFQRTFEATHLLTSVKAIVLKNNTVQITIIFNTKKHPLLSSEATFNGSMLRIQARYKVDVEKIYASEQEQQLKENLQKDKAKWKMDIITLDAGHGGKDPGASGPTGIKEKDVSLGIILRLGRLIQTYMPELKIVYTRKSDEFIELDERGKIANSNSSKLFVSVHCNASNNKNAKGVEVYLLGLHKTEAALAIAERENAVINVEKDFKKRYEKFNEENLIMISMAQNAFMKQSNVLAEYVSSMVINKTEQFNRGVKQAGFMVLWTPSMPSILVETGYITNKEEEHFLASEIGQQKIAESIFEAIVKYKEKYETN